MHHPDPLTALLRGATQHVAFSIALLDEIAHFRVVGGAHDLHEAAFAYAEHVASMRAALARLDATLHHPGNFVGLTRD